MVRLIGIPRAAANLIRENVDAGPGLVLWRVFLLIALAYGSAVVFAATGGGGLTAIVLGFMVTSIMSYAIRDDLLQIWRDLWNARWAEVDV